MVYWESGLVDVVGERKRMRKEDWMRKRIEVGQRKTFEERCDVLMDRWWKQVKW